MKIFLILTAFMFVTFGKAQAQTPKSKIVKGVAELQSQVHWQSNDSFIVDQMIGQNMRENHQKNKPSSCKFKIGNRVDGRFLHAQTRNEVENQLLASGISYIGFENVPEAPFMPEPKISIPAVHQAAWEIFRSKYIPDVKQKALQELNSKPYLRLWESVNFPENEVGSVCNQIQEYMSVVYRMKPENITCSGNSYATSLLKQDWTKATFYYYFPIMIEKCEYPEEEIEWEN